MNYRHISCRKTAPHLGAEISGVDLSKPLSPGAVQEVRHALAHNGVIGFRDQDLSVEQEIAFGAQFGKLYIHPVADLNSKHPEINPVYADEKSTRAYGEQWHSDASCDVEPPLGSILMLQEMPEVGGDTGFSSMYAAYDALSEPVKRFLEGLTAFHEGGHVFRRRWDPSKVYPNNEHPIVCVHPETGRKLLFVNEQYTTHIPQLRPDESDAVLQMLYRHVDSPEFHYRFQWRPGSVVFWDNRCVQHRAIFDYWPNRRVGTRVQVCGSKPVPACADLQFVGEQRAVA
jgi:taurine dioxygenase